jgi:hypothetical protein
MSKNDIQMFFHCKKCVEELPKGISPREWAHLEVGMTSYGSVQIWCIRHDEEVYNLLTFGESGDG